MANVVNEWKRDSGWKVKEELKEEAVVQGGSTPYTTSRGNIKSEKHNGG